MESRLTDERWTSVESELATRMQRPDFWNQPDRPAILSRFEVMDRVKAAAGAAAAWTRRLERSATPSGRSSRELVARLASQLFVVGHGIEDALTGAPVEVVLAVQPVLDRGTNAQAGVRWCERLLDMYRNWAALVAACFCPMLAMGRPAPACSSSRALVCGACSRAKLGLHVLDYEESDDSGRTVARVRVRTTPSTLPDSPAERYAVLSAELDKGPAPAAVVRRYRVDSSPSFAISGKAGAPAASSLSSTVTST